VTKRPLELLGHRGARGLAPENALPGFARLFGIGVSGVELDCAITRDGVVVIYHDAILNPDITRGPDGKWLETAGPAIATLTYAELQRYDVGRIKPGSDYEKRFPHQRPADGTRIPKLADLFALAGKSGNRSARFYLELKVSPLLPERTIAPDDFARKVIEVVSACGMTQRSLLLSFDWRTLAAARKIAPEIPTVCLTAQQPWLDNILADHGSSLWTAPLHVSQFRGSIPRMIQAAGGSVWAAFHEEINAEQVREAQSLGLKVVVWTVNEEADLRRMVKLGVDGIISDYPDRLRRVAGEEGVELPPSTPVTL
jgi:glycerophosphoryl diester phosphodiesterase